MRKTHSFLLFLSLFINHAYACLPSEVHIREQWINAYTKEDGTKISAHARSEHCREIKGHNYFQNSTNKNFKGLKTKFKDWNERERTLLNQEVEKLPSWLKKYRLSEVLRAAEQDKNPNNPAMTFPKDKTLIIFDKFFSMPNKKEIIIHEMSHIAVWDIDPLQLQEFFMSRGWEYEKGKLPAPPKKVILPDSADSPSEDFANSVELYYSDPKRLKEFNPKSFLILESIIKSKERQ